MRDYALLLLALILFPFVLTIGMVIHISKELSNRRIFSMRKYAFNIAKHLDKSGGAMLFNSEDRTISAMAYDRQIKWLVFTINWIFRDSNHCQDQWKIEINRGVE